MDKYEEFIADHSARMKKAGIHEIEISLFASLVRAFSGEMDKACESAYNAGSFLDAVVWTTALIVSEAVLNTTDEENVQEVAQAAINRSAEFLTLFLQGSAKPPRSLN